MKLKDNTRLRVALGIGVLAVCTAIVIFATGSTSEALAVYCLIVLGAATGSGFAMLYVGKKLGRQLDLFLIEAQANLRGKDEE